MSRTHLFLLAVLPAFLLVAACDKLESIIQTNQPPVIDRLYAARDRLLPLDTTLVRVEAHDPEGEELSISWTREAGALSTTSGSAVVWTAPQGAGSYRLTVEVRDASNKKVERSLTLGVLATQAPTVKIVQPQDGDFFPGLGVKLITVQASHPNGVARVEFRAGGEYLGADNSAPYEMPWLVEGWNGPQLIVAKAFRADSDDQPGSDSVRVSIEGVTRVR